LGRVDRDGAALSLEAAISYALQEPAA